MGERGCVGNFFFKKGKKTERTYETREDKKVGHVCVFFVVRVIKCVWGRGGSVCVGGGSSWAGQIGKKSRTVVLLRLKRTEAPAERIAVWRRDPPVWL